MKIRHEHEGPSTPYCEVTPGTVFEDGGVLYLEVSFRNGDEEGSVRLSDGVMVPPFPMTRRVRVVDVELVAL